MDQDMELIQLSMGDKHVLYSNGDFGVNRIAEEMAKEYGMQNDVIAKFNSPAAVELMMQANSAITKAAVALGREVPSHFYIYSLLQRNYHIARKAHTVFAFGQLDLNRKEVKGGTGWTVQLALDQSKEVFVYDIRTETWFRSETIYGIDPVQTC